MGKGIKVRLVAQPPPSKTRNQSSASRRARHDKFSLSSSDDDDDDDDDDDSDESDDSDDSDDSLASIEGWSSSDDDSDLSSSDSDEEEDSDDSDDSDESEDDKPTSTVSRRSQHTTHKSSSPANGAATNALLWPPNKHTLKVRFRNGDTRQRDAVKRFVTTHYHSVPMHIRFTFLDDHAPGPSDIRILFNTTKSESYIGRDAERHPGDTTMWLNWHPSIPDPDARRRQRQADVLHEFGHALGMVHEQQHPHCTAQWNYRVLAARHGWSDEKLRRAYEKVDSCRTRFSPYDPKSIMHYPVKPGDALNAVATVPLNRVLSEGDKQFLAAIYPVQQQKSSVRLPVRTERGKVVAPVRKPEVKKQEVKKPPRQPEVKKAVVRKPVEKTAVVKSAKKPVVKNKPDTNNKVVVRQNRNQGNSHSVVNWNGGNISIINSSNITINGKAVVSGNGNGQAVAMARGNGAMAMVNGGNAMAMARGGHGSSAMAMAGGGNAMAMVSGGGPGQFTAWAASGNSSAFASSWIQFN